MMLTDFTEEDDERIPEDFTEEISAIHEEVFKDNVKALKKVP